MKEITIIYVSPHEDNNDDDDDDAYLARDKWDTSTHYILTAEEEGWVRHLHVGHYLSGCVLRQFGHIARIEIVV